MKHVIVIAMGETDSGRRISVDRDAGGFRLETNDNRDGYIADGLIDLDLTLHNFYGMAEAADLAYRTLTAAPIYPTVEISEPYTAATTTTAPASKTKRGTNQKSAGTVHRLRVAELHAAGQSIKEIVAATGLSESTVYGHLKALTQEVSPAPASFPSNGNGAHA